jgi:hypothetical protein
MSEMLAPPQGETWKERLGLNNRSAPEFYESTAMVADAPHALAIRTAFDQLGVSGIFCVQGVPTMVVLNMAAYDAAHVVDLHGALWNQGLASLLLVTAGDILRVYSLARKPQRDWGHQFDRRCLIETLNATAHALEIRNLVYGAESGRLWNEHADYFQPKERIDQVLLNNLTQSHKLLSRTLSSEAAQALLIQTMFIAYLEDRKIVTPDYVRAATKKAADSFSALLEKRDVRLLERLFAALREDFNGDLFVAPCSFDPDAKAPTVQASHLDVIARFRTGREEMANQGQFRFWGYNFRYIPIELVSAVYDRFLGEREEDRKAKGAYYTPMYLADTVVSQLWERRGTVPRSSLRLRRVPGAIIPAPVRALAHEASIEKDSLAQPARDPTTGPWLGFKWRGGTRRAVLFIRSATRRGRPSRLASLDQEQEGASRVVGTYADRTRLLRCIGKKTRRVST